MSAGMPAITNAPELWRRIFFTLALILIYRIGVHVPTPGIDASVLQDFFSQNRGTIFGVINLFSGGALEKFSIFALGVMPYITASIVFQLLVVTIPQLEQLQKEGGDQGRRKINQYTRYATIGLSLFQGFMMATGLERITQSGTATAVINPGLAFRIETAITLTAGTAFLMWLGEQITERGVGNGISLIIMSGIAAGIPNGFFNMVEQLRNGQMSPLQGLFIPLVMVAVIAFIVLMERGQRRIPIQYARRVVGRKVYGGMSTHLPLKLNMSGVIPPIFASSIIFFPSTIATFVTFPFLQKIAGAMTGMGTLYNTVFGLMIVFFAFFYTAVTFNPMDVAENLRKQGGFVPGIRPGKPTGEYMDYILSRVTATGATYLTFICIMPAVLLTQTAVPFYFGGTSLLILVGVTMDTMAQVESILLSRNYEGLVKNVRLGGRKSSIGASV